MKKLRKWNRTIFSWRFENMCGEGLHFNLGGQEVVLRWMEIHSTRERTCKILLCLSDVNGGRLFEENKWDAVRIAFAKSLPDSWDNAAFAPNNTSGASRIVPLRNKQFCDAALDSASKILHGFGVLRAWHYHRQFTIIQDTWIEYGRTWIKLEDLLKKGLLPKY